MGGTSKAIFFILIGHILPNILSFPTQSGVLNNFRSIKAKSRNTTLKTGWQCLGDACLMNASKNDELACSRRHFVAATVSTAFVGVLTASPNESLARSSESVQQLDLAESVRTNVAAIETNTGMQITNHGEKSVEKSASILQESISGAFSGTAISTVKTLVKYPLDTATVRLQMPGSKFTIRELPSLFEGCFDGISAPLVSNIPAGAIFFAVKDATKRSLVGSGLPKWVSTSIAVGAALPPYWLIRNPSEVVKTRLQIGGNGYYEGMSTFDAFKVTMSRGGSTNSTINGLLELYQGYPENIIYGFPADVIKFVAYESLSGGRKNISPYEGAVYGALSTALSQLITTPLDVVRNRIMADALISDEGQNSDANENEDLSYFQRLTKIARDEGVSELFAGSVPRVGKAILSGALQFAAYEETKQKLSELFLKTR